jgi:hypothetical protein
MFRSSVDPSKIALTIKGAAAFVPTLVVFLKYFNVDVGPDELNAIVDSLADLVMLVGVVVSAAVTFFGLIRKMAVRLGVIK